MNTKIYIYLQQTQARLKRIRDLKRRNADPYSTATNEDPKA